MRCEEREHCSHHRRKLQQTPCADLRLQEAQYAEPNEADEEQEAYENGRRGDAVEPHQLRVQAPYDNLWRRRREGLVRLSAVLPDIPQGWLPGELLHKPVPATSERGGI